MMLSGKLGNTRIVQKFCRARRSSGRPLCAKAKIPDAYLKHEVEILPAAIHQMTHAEQVERCTHALDSLLKES